MQKISNSIATFPKFLNKTSGILVSLITLSSIYSTYLLNFFPITPSDSFLFENVPQKTFTSWVFLRNIGLIMLFTTLIYRTYELIKSAEINKFATYFRNLLEVFKSLVLLVFSYPIAMTISALTLSLNPFNFENKYLFFIQVLIVLSIVMAPLTVINFLKFVFAKNTSSQKSIYKRKLLLYGTINFILLSSLLLLPIVIPFI
ncbi:hypothetical protein A3K34_01505 [candidate division WWE3 bacterium RIFOXYC1_FULL_40_10]|uniref:Uncharacterized protein n=1 Tax=candidate division WWE3 bacterium RIFOXYA2_FULL_46_9 TaxID=1802636 RepID=A0A1F4W2H6_UNCKA|nr:MAG: hypothetical protein A3K58_01505 [candidate division WWE3 bacterium RIFOXYB1_FULL_40_22]OGC61543.1 MAG: hypothetical protein A3K37_01505 [candidate division WWE3 bacterium RIFOXYA1_FULL_40_11]OGC63591.1 MAG: hypothetical protein A2264_04445 [candidate division WWE3 bacterium RIFOXYA2_FULL_46_9]OGC64778.1 MAG: hypothetical protein A2326_01950 [candidate division WWE3 bacterium RIFOXYB2_FULL_41_6]OGC65926.1 MAG: hypothetical protein A3K34_01505 [candidate division WWE3 bacterium RIFOXYC1_